MKDTIIRDSRTTTLLVMSSLMLENIDWLESSQDKFVFPKKLKGALYTLTQELENWKRGIQYLAEKLPDQMIYKNGKPDSLKQFRHDYLIGKIKNEYIQI